MMTKDAATTTGALATSTGSEAPVQPATRSETTEAAEERRLPLGDLKDEHGEFRVIKVRDHLDEEAVEDYAEKLRAGKELLCV